MWSEVLPNGKVKFKERYKDPLTEKMKYVSITLDKNTPSARKAAERALLDRIDAIQTKTDTSKTTLYDLFQAYMAYQKKTVKQSTYRRNEGAIQRLITELGEDVIINNLRAQHVKDVLLSKGDSAKTMNERLKRLKAMLRWGYSNDYHSNMDLIYKLTLFRDDFPEDPATRYLEMAELNDLLNYEKNKGMWNWYYLTKFLILSGLRVGEALALTDKDVDLNSKIIHVSKTYDVINDAVTTTKTAKSTRDVYIQPELAELIKKISIRRKEIMLQSGFRSPLFFFDSKGKHIHYGAYNKYLREAGEKLLGRTITAHMLRHTHASILMAAGVDVETISRRLGHANSKVTREIYLHVMKELVERDNQQLSKVRIL